MLQIGLPELLAFMMLGGLLLYAVLGGADFGGGIWDLVATGPRAGEQRALIDRAIAPVWEANHVWLVLVVVILFTAFPAAYAAACIELHVPITLMMIGVVFRGSAFVFRKYATHGGSFQRRWGRVFAVSSLITPLFLGIILGAVTSGRLHVAGGEGLTFWARFIEPWLHPFPVLVGLFALCLFAFLAAAFLAVESPTPELQGDFRRRALIAAGMCLLMGGATALGASFREMAHIRRSLGGAWWIWLLVPAAMITWGGSFVALLKRRYAWARLGASGFVGLVMSGWALGQYPYLISPSITIRNAAAPAATLELLFIALLLGAFILFPSTYWLFRVFKRAPEKAVTDE